MNSDGSRAELLGMTLDCLTLRGAVDRLLEWASQRGGCRYVVTPNVDHVVMLQEHPAFAASYRDASLVLADGWPVVLASRLLGRPVPERVAGSDLVPALFDATTAERRLHVYLLGAAPGVADRAAAKVHQRWQHVRVVGTCSPPLGFQHDDQQNSAILAEIAAAQPDVLIVGLGAPKQELWVHRHRQSIAAPVALCVGATIDFLAGHKLRAPQWMRRSGLEWFHRMLSEPRRLVKRYARDAWLFPQLVLQHARR